MNRNVQWVTREFRGNYWEEKERSGVVGGTQITKTKIEKKKIENWKREKEKEKGSGRSVSYKTQESMFSVDSIRLMTFYVMQNAIPFTFIKHLLRGNGSSSDCR